MSVAPATIFSVRRCGEHHVCPGFLGPWLAC